MFQIPTLLNPCRLQAEDVRPASPVHRSPSPLPPRASGRPARRIRPPKRYRDESPAPPPPVEIPDVTTNDESPVDPATRNNSPRWFKTEPNAYGLYKVFPHPPTRDPDQLLSLEDLCRSSELLIAEQPRAPVVSQTVPTAPWFPFLNSTVARLMTWFHGGSNLKSIAELDALVEDVLLKEDFDPAHLQNFSAARENKRLDDSTASAIDEAPAAPDRWKTASIKIKLPTPKNCVAERDAPEFEVPGLMYRPLLDVMVEAFQSPAFAQYHTTPFEYRWDPQHNPNDPDIHLDPADVALDEHKLPVLPDGHEVMYGEIYTSSRMLKAHNALPKIATPNLETIIAAYMFWSDATHLANFGNASLWPLYTFFGNLSKYTRAKPSSNGGYHQAYFPSLPDSIKDFYRQTFGIAMSADVWAHLKRELMYGIWDLLLCPQFIHVYVHGIVIKCYDGVERLVFPRFFTYGADYPEKVLLATIKYFGGCPCPRCLIEKDQIPAMGTKADFRRRQNIRQDTPWYRRTINLARKWIFEKGFLVAGAAVNRLLKPTSLVLTCNAFSKLDKHGFNFFSMFVPDFLHEVELGGWKSLFIHLIRILHTRGQATVDEFNERFRKVPIFGKSTICRFHSNVSEMKKPAAQDFEDVLQCCIPVFEGLLPEPHNTIVLSLLFTFATWHASTIRAFRTVTTVLGAKARHFLKTTCEAYTTYELPQEQTRRARSQARKNSKSQGAPVNHSFGDYPDIIPDVGTCDSYSTVLGELAHRVAKKFYVRTNKRNFVKQIAAHERRKRLLRIIKQRMNPKPAPQPAETTPRPLPKDLWAETASRLAPEDDVLIRTPPRQRYHISESKRTWVHALDLPDDFPDDPALLNFLPDLKSHLLGRLLKIPYSGDENQFSKQDLADVNIVQNKLYTHKLLRINYTTYDLGRDKDTLNTRTHPDIMVLAHEDEDESSSHPYWYGRIVGIFHVEVRHVGPRSKNTAKIRRMDFVWVRWFGRDMDHAAGWNAKRLHRVGFLDASDPDSGAFGTSDLLAPSIARHFDAENQEDYRYYYVNQDMFMRYAGNTVGHRNIPVLADMVDANQPDSDDDELDVDPLIEVVRAESQSEIIEEDPGSDGEDSDSNSESSSSSEESEEEEEDEDEVGMEGLEPTDEDFLESAGFDDM
ncbi:GLOBIN domain-containing protein [Mycena venus]|uniref:GLOBIN domain-containing protein n=1 Tax=Mycena venus TaxID=2733690 RepID=A0A8H6WUE1_9AGAR|nr:GLOBIN domain-containing protein [Mycena venus]